MPEMPDAGSIKPTPPGSSDAPLLGLQRSKSRIAGVDRPSVPSSLSVPPAQAGGHGEREELVKENLLTVMSTLS